jgi:CRP/FNR family cyclic AMP-dependent transcriptional regulator
MRGTTTKRRLAGHTAAVISRFQGSAGRQRLIDAFREQHVVCHKESLAKSLSAAATIRAYDRGDTLMSQGGVDTDVYFILSGSVTILVNDRDVAVRGRGEHVGEMSLLDPSARRSATVVATESTAAARIDEGALTAIANKHPEIWRRFAVCLSNRLRQRAIFHREKNAAPRLFIGSSREALPLASAVKGALRRDSTEVALWSDGVFAASRLAMEDLEKEVQSSDFALLVATPDDVVTSRKHRNAAPRDNVLFELGLFMGGISRHRTFLLVPARTNMKLPTDLLGITLLFYDPKSSVPSRAVAAAVKDLRKLIALKGAR